MVGLCCWAFGCNVNSAVIKMYELVFRVILFYGVFLVSCDSLSIDCSYAL